VSLAVVLHSLKPTLNMQVSRTTPVVVAYAVALTPDEPGRSPALHDHPE
jgi:hypothetical protein